MIPKPSRFKCERCGYLKKRPGKCVWCGRFADFDNLMEVAWQTAGTVTSLPHSCAALHKHATVSQRGDKNPNYKGPLALSNYQHKKLWRKRNPEKAFAHDVFAAAIRAGKIKRGVCEVCGSEKTDGHHDDYSKPLAVRWLCRKHHSAHVLKPVRARLIYAADKP